eukprot:Blabericola_migrator_1__5955@NODE_2_length_32877_cov_165_790003_g1_i0_p14_GENE_NODE_2_length_32877_cov_165_790003_g1_i0NODE_2_length_32877_cov_165_790003_g1_i0_p14_ORF_typecomplete_len358_score64_42NAMassociated/PF14303_6/0_00073NAMassociated/PF14303_6/1_8e04Borrelia_P83/PF05262_11/0_0047PRKCSHlike/PF12999_7/0_27PRKCSHlike/PF12999_7/2e03BUD22/PF09073_10/4e02BUD22/PF09073_10/0_048FYDLN_acid/PF09538_10/1_9e03FYDLN_acid/PF09538_10/0_38_NODE_2_length_32877_cov_165_790003_g1_i031324205
MTDNGGEEVALEKADMVETSEDVEEIEPPEAIGVAAKEKGLSDENLSDMEEIAQRTGSSSPTLKPYRPSEVSSDDKQSVPPAKPVIQTKRKSFQPRGNDTTWIPQVADIVWTRFDKSRTQALAIIIRCPKSEEGHKYDSSLPSVYCETDADDRYLVAFIHSDAHVYPPRHYLIKFDFESAPNLKCMKWKLSKLSPWDKLKRKAVRDALEYERGTHKFEKSHNFIKCCTCCAEGSDEFWAKMKLTRGNVHIEMKRQQEEKKRLAQEKKEAQKKARAQEKKAKQQKARADTSDGDSSSSGVTADEDEGQSTSGDSGAESSSESDEESSDVDSRDNRQRRKRRLQSQPRQTKSRKISAEA